MRDVTIFTFTFLNKLLISTHTPREGRDRILCVFSMASSLFLLTRPVRDVTVHKVKIIE